MIGHTLIGTVTAFTGRYFTVTSPNAPAHLQILYLLPRQIGAAKVGDRVRLPNLFYSRAAAQEFIVENKR